MTDDAGAVLGAGMKVIAREPISGGLSAASAFKITVLLTDVPGRVERTLLLKQTSTIEVGALTAAARVSHATAIPELWGTGENADGPYVLTAFYDGVPAPSESTLPANVIETLARLHAHYLSEPVPTDVPAIDSHWWRAKCEVSMQRLEALDRPVGRQLRAQVNKLKSARAILDALDVLPRTLIHGDVHRNNVLVDKTGQGHIIDWGGSFIAAPALDLAHLGGPNSSGYQTYLRIWRELTGDDLAANPTWHYARHTATVWANIKYLAFATKVFGDDRGREMMATAKAALTRL